MKLLHILLATSLVVASCSDQSAVNPVKASRTSNGASIDKVNALIGATFLAIGQTFKVMHNKRQVIRTEKGTRIHIPENAFVVKEDGTPVQGEVDLEFKEYSNRGEIIASDIPMYYIEESGEKQYFESAGMFEIRASQNGKELEIADGKEIKVELATDVDGPFNFWELNDDRSNWELKDTDCKPIKNPYIEEQEDELEALNEAVVPAPKRPVKYTSGDPIFDIRLVGLNNNALAELNGVMWKYSGDDPKLNPSEIGAFDTDYTLVYLEPTEESFLEYQLTFETKDKRELVIDAVPIFQGKLLDRENKRIAEIIERSAAASRKIKEISDQLKREKSLLRAFNVGEMGIYNYDVYYNDPRVKHFQAEFSLEGGASIENLNFYLLPTDRRIVIKYYEGSFEKFSINPNIANRLIAVDKDNQVYYLSRRDIDKMNLKKVPKDSKVNFHLKKHSKIEDPTQLEAFIQSI